MITVKIGDCRKLIHEQDDESVDCVVTSPPYWGLRDYKTEPLVFDGLLDCEHEWGAPIVRTQSGGTKKATVYNNIDDRIHYEVTTNFCSKCGAWRGQLGLEPTPELFIKHLLDFFDSVKPKLKVEGNCFVNLGDTYSGSGGADGDYNEGGLKEGAPKWKQGDSRLKPKSLCLIPQRFAWGMIERGWILRNEIIWHKPNHMPESVTDRLTKAHEVIWHFVKQQRYYYNLDAIREPFISSEKEIKRQRRINNPDNKFSILTGQKAYSGGLGYHKHSDNSSRTTAGLHEGRGDEYFNADGKNPSDVWEITTQPYSGAHFAVFPLELVRRPILAGCPENGTVLDPFAGSGTVGEFCRHNNRNAVLFELNPAYKRLIDERAMITTPELSAYATGGD